MSNLKSIFLYAAFGAALVSGCGKEPKDQGVAEDSSERAGLGSAEPSLEDFLSDEYHPLFRMSERKAAEYIKRNFDGENAEIGDGGVVADIDGSDIAELVDADEGLKSTKLWFYPNLTDNEPCFTFDFYYNSNENLKRGIENTEKNAKRTFRNSGNHWECRSFDITTYDNNSFFRYSIVVKIANLGKDENVQEKNEKRLSQSDTVGLINDLCTATHFYKSDEGRLPIAGIENLIAVLSSPGKRGLPYFEPLKGPFYNGRVIIDHLGQPLVYRVDGNNFKIYSIGSNGIDENGHGDDITK